MIVYNGMLAAVLDPLAQILAYGNSPIRTATGAAAADAPGTGASAVRETVVIGGSATTAVSITGTVDDVE